MFLVIQPVTWMSFRSFPINICNQRVWADEILNHQVHFEGVQGYPISAKEMRYHGITNQHVYLIYQKWVWFNTQDLASWFLSPPTSIQAPSLANPGVWGPFDEHFTKDLSWTPQPPVEMVLVAPAASLAQKYGRGSSSKINRKSMVWRSGSLFF